MLQLSVSHSEVDEKGKAIPVQALSGPEGSERLILPDSQTMGTWMFKL
jgi:hypothetical protein